MTRESYFEMCEALGSEPDPLEVPLDLSDFPDLVQNSYDIFRKLPDMLDTFGGNLLGKDMHNVFTLMELYDIVEKEEKKLSFTFIQVFDGSVRSVFNKKNKDKSKKPAKS